MTTRFKTAADFRKSLENRLKNMATEKGENLQRLRRKVAFDRLLARLFSSEEQSFFLKGGYAMELRLKTARATKDIDLTSLKRLKGESDLLSAMILEELRMLAQQDLGDFFVYRIGEAQLDLDNAPYGGARYSVTALLDGKVFVRFQLDVGADAVVTRTETMRGADWLGFCGIPSPVFFMISIEQQFAEKLHAYTLPRLERPNTRVKDLVDMVLLAKMRSMDFEVLKEALRLVFKVRQTHPLPQKVDAPPQAWEVPYNELAKECALMLSLDEAFWEVEKVYSHIQA
ncbi:MAG: nucleotidyl transferase AbiEii/AbiGii toxin family protein [Rhabdochlamydiaceae bacterium]|nr:nucleotidyl transferase AbiEii/AbiGii toxin family protein [Rhabdochlamydiaceae bacterium]